MRARLRRLASASVLIVAAQLFSLSAVAAQPTITAAETPVQILGGDETAIRHLDGGAVEQRATAFVFPNHLGVMPIRRVDIYGAADVSAYYTRRGGAGGDPWLSVYVYPAAIAIDEEARNVEGALIDKMRGRPAAAPFAETGEARDGIQRWFDGEIDGIKIKTGFVLVLRGGWFIKARLTMPTNGTPDAGEISQAALAAIPWTWMPAGRAPVGTASTGQ